MQMCYGFIELVNLEGEKNNRSLGRIVKKFGVPAKIRDPRDWWSLLVSNLSVETGMSCHHIQTCQNIFKETNLWRHW